MTLMLESLILEVVQLHEDKLPIDVGSVASLSLVDSRLQVATNHYSYDALIVNPLHLFAVIGDNPG